MTTKKSLNEQVSEIINSNASRAKKSSDLKKLGITPYEIIILLDNASSVSATRTIAQRMTFGVEIETYGMSRENLLACARINNLPVEYQGYNHRDSKTIYKFVSDASIQGANAIECVTPVLNKSQAGLRALKKCCYTLNQAGARVNRSTGLHVHIGCKTMTAKQYVNVFANYRLLERVIDSFMASSRRGNNSQWCASLLGHNFDYCTTPEHVRAQLNYGRYHKVNAESYARHKTIEFRQHQGSTDFEKISKWVEFCAKLVAWSRDNRLTSEVTSIDAIPFLTASEKAFFKARKEQLA